METYTADYKSVVFFICFLIAIRPEMGHNIDAEEK